MAEWGGEVKTGVALPPQPNPNNQGSGAAAIAESVR